MSGCNLGKIVGTRKLGRTITYMYLCEIISNANKMKPVSVVTDLNDL